MRHKFVFDEDCSTKFRGEINEYCINARFLYKLVGIKPTWGQPDLVLMELCKKLDLTLITCDKRLIQRCMKRKISVASLENGKILLFSEKVAVLEASVMGEKRKFNSSTEHLAVYDPTLVGLARLQRLK